MFSFGCVKTVVLAVKKLVKPVYSLLFGFSSSRKLLSFAPFSRDFYYTFPSSFWVVFYSARLVVLPIFHRPNNKDEFKLNTIFISGGVL